MVFKWNIFLGRKIEKSYFLFNESTHLFFTLVVSRAVICMVSFLHVKMNVRRNMISQLLKIKSILIGITQCALIVTMIVQIMMQTLNPNFNCI